MTGKRSNEQQKKPLASQDSSEDTSSDSSNIPNTPSSKRPRTSAVPQLRVSSSASNVKKKKKKEIKPVAGNPPQRVSEEDTSSDSSSSKLPPKNKGTEGNMVELGVEEDVKKPLFQRLFSEEDEIVLLEGLFRFLKDEADDVSGPVNQVKFHESMKGSFPTEFAKNQLSDKIKRLKKRFQRNKGRVFKPDSHGSRIFELSNKIWGEKELEQEKSVLPPNHYCVCKSGFVNSCFAGYAQEILGVMSEGRPTMKKELKDLMIKECELEKEKIEFFMKHLNSQA
ncbi:hypothetical protein HRI_003186000 [Hibiscus trionum]|uniref:Glabrous enhancer-binding protein-like DBD domain-containing protein n=1 Tax=Hibiscus trionum TaxID=183268 RepID=A0A9W7IHC3_HIBTR|nr:hypothetical protein HRI_003186000 [Hibiscus trionum]